jgi:predicted membrane chloride channel (bestrophin family)
LKFLLHTFGFEFIALTGLVTALIGGVTFTIGILVAGTMPDFKESEKIPGEIALAIKTLYKDSLIVTKDPKILERFQKNVKNIIDEIVENFKAGTWRQREINENIDLVDRDIQELADKGVQANYIIKMRNELTNIERLSNRVETIKETSFLPTMTIVAKLIVVMVIGLLLFVVIDPFVDGLVLIAIVSFLLIGLLYIMKDIDDPFEGGQDSFADVDLEHIFKTQKYLESRMKNEGK